MPIIPGSQVVTPGDIAVALGRTPPAEGSLVWEQWTQWIGEAEMLIYDELGDLALLDQTKLAYVIRSAVKAVAKHPDDATTVEISVDDGRVSKRYESGTGDVTILPRWWALLRPAGSDSGAFSVRPSFQPDRVCESWR